MNRFVLDTGTCLHWFLSHHSKTREVEAARQLLSHVSHRRVGLVQPAAWATMLIAELVASRFADAATAAEEILGVQVRIDNSPATLRSAVQLAERLDRPVLQTIFHAVALRNNVYLITSDESYFRRAKDLGNVMRLRDWRWKTGIAEPARDYDVRRNPVAVAARFKSVPNITTRSLAAVVQPKRSNAAVDCVIVPG